jgi:AcrR family transcriptional regulator
MARRRLSRAESRQQTRERLLGAAEKVFRRHGYRRATIEQVAAEAGYTIGALYSNFDGKDDLLLALVEHHIARIAERVVSSAAGEDDALEKLRSGAREWMAFLDEEPELYALLIEFWTIWVRDPALRPHHAERFAMLRQALGGLVEQRARAAGVTLALPAEDVGAAIVALSDGLALQRLADPDAISDELLASLLTLVVPALAQENGPRRAGRERAVKTG